MTDKEILNELCGNSPLAQMRRLFTARAAEIEQSLGQLSPTETRRMEFNYAQEMLNLGQQIECNRISRDLKLEIFGVFEQLVGEAHPGLLRSVESRILAALDRVCPEKRRRIR